MDHTKCELFLSDCKDGEKLNILTNQCEKCNTFSWATIYHDNCITVLSNCGIGNIANNNTRQCETCNLSCSASVDHT